MAEQMKVAHLPPPLISVAGWLVPGLGYFLIGQRGRAAVASLAIILLYLLGLFLAGIRVIEVPGYDDQTGMQIRMYQNQRIQPRDSRYPNAGSALMNGGFVAEIANKPWFVGQVLAGPIALASAAISVDLAQAGSHNEYQSQTQYPRPHAPMEMVGTLYTAIAGMLNLLVIIDATHRAAAEATP